MFSLYFYQKGQGENGEGGSVGESSEVLDGDRAAQEADAMSHHSHATSHRTGVSRGSKASRSKVMGGSRGAGMMDTVSDVEEVQEEKPPTFLESHTNKG